MMLADVQHEMQRLYAGNRKANQLTPERLSAYLERWKHHSVIELRAAVDELLGEPAMPTLSRMDAALDRAAEAIRQRSNQRERNEAARFMNGCGLPVPSEQPAIHQDAPDESERLWAAMHYALLIAITQGAVAPEDVARWNAEIARAHSDGRGPAVLEQIRRLARISEEGW